MAPPMASPALSSRNLDSPTFFHPTLRNVSPSPSPSPVAGGTTRASAILDRRPKSSSANHPSFINTFKAFDYEPRATTPLSAVPALGGAMATTETAALTPSSSPSPSSTWGAGSTTTTTTTIPVDAAAATISDAAQAAQADTTESISPRSNAFPPAIHCSSGIPHGEKLSSARFTPEPLMLRQPHLPAEDVSVLSPKPEDALSLDGMLSSSSATAASMHDTLPNPPLSEASLKLADALNSLARRRRSSATTTTALAALKSPCFYHQRFDDAVDIDKVLEEIKNGESMSHSHLVQTATSVREVSKQLQRRPIRRAVRNVMIVTKARDNQLVHLTRELAGWLLRTPRYGSHVGVNVYVDVKLRNSHRFDAPGLVAENPAFDDMLRYWDGGLCWSRPETFDLVLTLGGDGTVLFTSWLFQGIVPPVLSFSLGSLGFMTTFEFEKYRQDLDRIMGDEGMTINLRMRFTCSVWRDGAESASEQFEVLNELVIDRGPSPYVSNLELYGDGHLLTVVQADGCIFSTPTGSTAYSLSAGGSLVHPDIPAILLTPICPHTLSFRPMVLSDTMDLQVEVPRTSRATAYCAFDGKGRVELRQGDRVKISASRYPFPTVTSNSTEWFKSVSSTLRWNTRAAAQKPFEGAGYEGGAMGKEETWDIDIDTDSAYYASEEGSVSTSPIRRQMSMLGL
ncbi:NAD+ kinase [Cordyceps militaris]|uniref:NAD+ kinase n=1 Tax=Cordyceps militaris TaxID=73501 RepID=A0A2H4S8V5_CORMI|nr:NAD+ kinase [Cordyceps militaris]